MSTGDQVTSAFTGAMIGPTTSAAPKRKVTDQPDTVYAHVERTVHALCAGIEQELDNPRDIVTSTSRIKVYSEAVQALSSWPQFNPMNSHEQYQQLAEYEVEKALRARVGAHALALFAKHVQETNAR